MKEEIKLNGTLNENYIFVETALNKQIEVTLILHFSCVGVSLFYF